MADYDFGSLASPVKKEAPKQSYDFGALASPVKAASPITPINPISSTNQQYSPVDPDHAGVAQGKRIMDASRQASQEFMPPEVGIGEAALQGATGLGASAIAGIRGVGNLIGTGIQNQKDKGLHIPTRDEISAGYDEAGRKVKSTQEAMTYQPRTGQGKLASEVASLPFNAAKEASRSVGGDIGQAVNGAKGRIAGESIGEVAPDIVGTVLGGKSSQTAKNIGRTVVDVAKPAVEAVSNAGSKIAKAVPTNIKLSPEMADLNAAARRIGVNLQPHQLSSNRLVKTAGSELSKIPLSGNPALANQTAWEKALIKEIGGDSKAERLTPKVFDQALRTSGSKIGRITGKYQFEADKPFLDKLVEAQNKALKEETADTARIFNSKVDDLYAKLKDGKMDGIAFRKFNTDLSLKIKRTTQPDLKNSLSDFQDNILEQFNKNVKDPKDAIELKQARTEYAKAKAIIPMVGKPQGVSPSALRPLITNTKFGKELYARGKSSLKDLADIGDMLKDPPSSGTAERNLVYGTAGLLGGAAAPAAAVPAAVGLYGAANLYNRLGHKLLPNDAPPVPKGYQP